MSPQQHTVIANIKFQDATIPFYSIDEKNSTTAGRECVTYCIFFLSFFCNLHVTLVPFPIALGSQGTEVSSAEIPRTAGETKKTAPMYVPV